ncbi:MAG: hypothetical protein RLZ97_409, partial [Verrucomicrobiota bacterium]
MTMSSQVPMKSHNRNRWVLAVACMVLTGVIGGLKIARQDVTHESKD